MVNFPGHIVQCDDCLEINVVLVFTPVPTDRTVHGQFKFITNADVNLTF